MKERIDKRFWCIFNAQIIFCAIPDVSRLAAFSWCFQHRNRILRRLWKSFDLKRLVIFVFVVFVVFEGDSFLDAGIPVAEVVGF